MKELKGMLKSKVLRFVLVVVAAMSVMTQTAFAATPAPVDFSGVTSALTGAFTVGEIASVIGVILGTGVVFVIFWWGARKLVRGVISAFKSGRLRF